MEEKLRQLMAATKRHRRVLYALALALFVGGVAYSLATTDISASDIHVWPALALLVVMTPLSLAYGAYNLIIIGDGLGARLSFRTGFNAAGSGAILLDGVRVEAGETVESDAGIHRSVRVGKGLATLWFGERAPISPAEPFNGPVYTAF